MQNYKVHSTIHSTEYSNIGIVTACSICSFAAPIAPLTNSRSSSSSSFVVVVVVVMVVVVVIVVVVVVVECHHAMLLRCRRQ